jgi:hypothetical protein
MAVTKNAEYQANFRAKQAEKIASLSAEVEALNALNADLSVRLEKANAKVAALQKKVKAATAGKA